MASIIKSGESLFIPFCNGNSFSDSQLKPRMYKTKEAFQRSFPGYYKGTEGVELVEYAPVVHGRWDRSGYCTVCDWWTCYGSEYKYCPNCGARMDLEVE